MEEALELHDSDISNVEDSNGDVKIIFSAAYIHAERKGWLQEAVLLLHGGKVMNRPSQYPVTVSDGHLVVGGKEVPNLLSLPFSLAGECLVKLVLTNGEALEVAGADPRIQLIGERKFVEEVQQS